MIAAFNQETNTNNIHIGEGYTVTEAIARAVNLDFSEEEIRNIVNVYSEGQEGLIEWYLERGIFLSEPLVLYSDKKRGHRSK
jgi:hypothetical protein